MKSLQLKKGESFFTEGGKDAYKIRAGAADVFLVPMKEASMGRRVLICEAREGDTLPGIDFTDDNHIHWQFCFRALDDVTITVIEAGLTNVLKKRFAERADLDHYDVEGFEHSLLEQYNKQKIREDLNISQKEAGVQQAAAQREEAIRKITKPSSGGDAGEIIDEGKTIDERKTIDAFRRVWAFARDHLKQTELWLTFILTVCLAITGVSMLMIGDHRGFTAALIITVIVILLREMWIGRISSRTGSKLQEKALDRVFALEEEYYRKYGRAEMAGLCMNVYQNAKDMVASVCSASSGLLISMVLFIVVIYLRPVMGICYLLAAGGSGVVMLLLRQRADRYRREISSNNRAFDNRLYHNLRNIHKIKISGSEENILRDLAVIRSGRSHERAKSILRAGTADAVRLMIMAAAVPLIVQDHSAGSWIVPLSILGGYWIQTVQHLSRMPGLAGEMWRLELLLDGEDGSAKKPIDAIETIEMENVAFGYGGRNVIDGLNLTLRHGETIGLVGESGSGKSTILKLLTGMERPQSGEIRVNGIDIGDIDRLSFRQRIGMALQDDALITGSIMDNIRMGQDVPAEEVFDAMVKADLGDFISSLPMGADTLVSEAAGNVSGGQKQKILIARTLLRKPDVLILDESMGEMDNDSIARICSALRKISAAKIIVSHRIEPLEYCDRIVVT
ncbi:MAG: ATP-binding cassette domain-containing protein [Bacillota bacterium]|nr:ATP-binding cassette domain-containing protein [Bacillota bacterium]